MFSVKFEPTFFTGSGRLALECPANVSVVVKREKFFESFKLSCFFECKSGQAPSMLLLGEGAHNTHPRRKLTTLEEVSLRNERAIGGTSAILGLVKQTIRSAG